MYIDFNKNINACSVPEIKPEPVHPIVSSPTHVTTTKNKLEPAHSPVIASTLTQLENPPLKFTEQALPVQFPPTPIEHVPVDSLLPETKQLELLRLSTSMHCKIRHMINSMLLLLASFYHLRLSKSPIC